MASPTTIFFIFLFGLIIASIVWNFWIWLVVAAVIFIGIIITIIVIQYQHDVRARRSVQINRNPPTPKEVFQRNLRNQVDNEWRRQASDDFDRWV